MAAKHLRSHGIFWVPQLLGMGCQSSGWVGSTADGQTREAPLAGMALDHDGFAEGGPHGQKCGCFGWMSIRRVRQTSAELLTSLTSRSCSGWAPRWCPRIGRRSAGSGGGRNGGRRWRTWMCWVPHILASSTRMHMDSVGSAAEFPPRLVQPVAGSAGEFLPRLVQAVLLMQW